MSEYSVEFTPESPYWVEVEGGQREPEGGYGAQAAVRLNHWDVDDFPCCSQPQYTPSGLDEFARGFSYRDLNVDDLHDPVWVGDEE